MLTLEAARAWYPEVDPVHGFDHIERVYRMAEKLARLEGADLEIVHAAALLHDSRGSDPNSGERLSHHEASARFAEQVLREEGWSEERIQAVQHCIRAHRYRGEQENEPQTIEAKVLFDADKLDVLGAIGVARTIGYAVQAGQPIYAEPTEQFLTTGSKQPGRSAQLLSRVPVQVAQGQGSSLHRQRPTHRNRPRRLPDRFLRATAG